MCLLTCVNVCNYGDTSSCFSITCAGRVIRCKQQRQAPPNTSRLPSSLLCRPLRSDLHRRHALSASAPSTVPPAREVWDCGMASPAQIFIMNGYTHFPATFASDFSRLPQVRVCISRTRDTSLHVHARYTRDSATSCSGRRDPLHRSSTPSDLHQATNFCVDIKRLHRARTHLHRPDASSSSCTTMPGYKPNILWHDTASTLR